MDLWFMDFENLTVSNDELFVSNFWADTATMDYLIPSSLVFILGGFLV